MRLAGLFALLLNPLTQAAPPPGIGTIVFYRPGTVAGLASPCPIRYKGRQIVELGRNKFAEWRVKPGRYILANKGSGVEVSVDAGETRYVRCDMKLALIGWRADLHIVDEESFQEHRAEFERKEAVPEE